MSESETQLLESLKSQVEAARLQAELSALKAATRQNEAAAAVVAPIMEAMGDVVDRSEYLYDTPGWGRDQGSVVSMRGDREDGRYRPIFEDEMTLGFIRGAARWTCDCYPSAQNILESLANYTIGTGTSMTAEPKGGCPADIVRIAQEVLDAMDEDNNWSGDLEREILQRAHKDGESLLWVRPSGWRCKLSIPEPEELCEPSQPRALEDWLELDGSFNPSWSFGVLTRRDTPEEPLGYHFVFNESGTDWEFVRANRVVHIKRNVPRAVKRGISDFFSTRKTQELAEKVLHNAGHGAAVQAAIAWIVEHAPSTDSGQAASMIAGLRTSTYSEPTQSGTKQRSVERMKPGKVIHTPSGTNYKPAPMGSQSAPNFMAVEQALLRYAGIRWAMPEYLVSGDASNNNFASSLVAEAPFVKGREADQAFYGRYWQRLAWASLRIAWEAGRFDAYHLDWEDLKRFLRVNVPFPDVATRDRYADAQTKEIEKRNGILSPETWAQEVGRDYAEERKRGAKTFEEAQMEIQQQAAQAGDPMAALAGMLGGEPAASPESPAESPSLESTRRVLPPREVVESARAGLDARRRMAIQEDAPLVAIRLAAGGMLSRQEVFELAAYFRQAARPERLNESAPDEACVEWLLRGGDAGLEWSDRAADELARL